MPQRIPHGNNNHNIRIIVRKNAYSVSETWLSIECGICGCCITACNVGIRDCFFFLLSTLLKFISILHVKKIFHTIIEMMRRKAHSQATNIEQTVVLHHHVTSHHITTFCCVYLELFQNFKDMSLTRREREREIERVRDLH